MNNERFFNTYVELLTSNFHDALGKNIVFQAQAKINAEDQEELKKKVEILENKLKEFNDIEKNIEEKDHQLLDKNAEIGRLKNEFEQVKAETNHLNTFKNELISARQEIQNKEKEKEKIALSYEKKIEELNSKIEYLQMTPAQRRKFDAKNDPVLIKEIKEEVESYSKDGGIF